ncbi:hypothetical protein DL765_008392 [Monosporascus sp. GIB2]|nr:hypothetical protein DL765_008392 [Monosporascus sp. GIB2]
MNFLGRSTNRSDVQLFLDAYRPDTAAGSAAASLAVKLVAGATDEQDPLSAAQLEWRDSSEATLDTQAVLGTQLAAAADDDEETVSPQYACRVCAESARLGARGFSVLVASGDFGVSKERHCFRRDEEGEDDGGSNSSRRLGFMPSFPASCP